MIVAAADQFHVSLCSSPGRRQTCPGGEAVGRGVAACEQLQREVHASGLVFQVGNNKRFDPGIACPRLRRRRTRPAHGLQGLVLRLGLSLCHDRQPAAHRPAQQPGAAAGRQPQGKRSHYYLLTHGSHLVDTARYLGGEIEAVQARLLQRFDAWCWFVDVAFADGSLGHLELIVAVRGDWEEGFQLYGEHGSVKGKVFLPWFHKSSEVECFSTADGQYRRVLGADAYTYKLQIEGWADAILTGAPLHGANLADGVAACAPWWPSPARWRRGSRCAWLTFRGACDGDRHLRQDLHPAHAGGRRSTQSWTTAWPACSSTSPTRGCRRCPMPWTARPPPPSAGRSNSAANRHVRHLRHLEH